MRLPKNVKKSIHIYQKNGNTYWKDAIDKEMKKSNISYKPIEYCTQYMTCNCVIFDVKIDFTWKARFVANGSNTESPVALTCSSVLSSYSVQLAFLIAALNDLSVMTCGIGNAYLNTPL